MIVYPTTPLLSLHHKQNMFSRAYIQELGASKLRAESQSVFDTLSKGNIAIELFTTKKMHRRQLRLARDVFFVADIDLSLKALKILDISYRKPLDYPTSLTNFMHRKVWRSTISELTSSIKSNNKPLFAKPADDLKRFTGQVFSKPSHLNAINKVPRHIDILCSEIVQWVSEYRVYVCKSKILGIHQYQGDPDADIDVDVVNQAIQNLDKQNESVAGYALDFGILESGETALVEFNEGFGLGNYGLDSSSYTELLLARWQELMAI